MIFIERILSDEPRCPEVPKAHAVLEGRSSGSGLEAKIGVTNRGTITEKWDRPVCLRTGLGGSHMTSQTRNSSDPLSAYCYAVGSWAQKPLCGGGDASHE